MCEHRTPSDRQRKDLSFRLVHTPICIRHKPGHWCCKHHLYGQECSRHIYGIFPSEYRIEAFTVTLYCAWHDSIITPPPPGNPCWPQKRALMVFIVRSPSPTSIHSLFIDKHRYSIPMKYSEQRRQKKRHGKRRENAYCTEQFIRNTCRQHFRSRQRRYFQTFQEPRNRFRKLIEPGGPVRQPYSYCTRFLAPIDCSKIQHGARE